MSGSSGSKFQSDSESDYGPESEWQQTRQYVDHLGHPVVMEQYVEPDWTPDPIHQVPIQVYSLVPLDPDHRKLRRYLMRTFADDEKKPFFEIYSYCPSDAYSCIKHHRREIAYRKDQDRSGVSDPPPLIPQFFQQLAGPPIARCVLIRSHSYRLGDSYDDEKLAEIGEGPDFVDFNRSFSRSRGHVDNTQRLLSIAHPDKDICSEALELSIQRENNQTRVGMTVMLDIFQHAAYRPDRGLRTAMDVDEGEPLDETPASEEHIRQQLGQESVGGPFDLDPSFRVSQSSGAVFVTNTPLGTESDLQYPVVVPFLGHLRGPAALSLLETTARLFTTALMSHLPAPKTINLKFYLPESTNWPAPAAADHNALRAEITSFPVGALHTISRRDQPPAPHHISPQFREDTFGNASLVVKYHYEVFAIVLDRPNFISEAGVYFDMDERAKPAWDDYMGGPGYVNPA